MAGSFLTDDLEMLLQTGDFAVSATFGGATISIIFDEEYLGQDVGGSTLVSGSNPIAYCRTSDVSAAAQDSTIVIDSTTYTVIDVENDNTGMTLLRLRT